MKKEEEKKQTQEADEVLKYLLSGQVLASRVDARVSQCRLQ